MNLYLTDDVPEPTKKVLQDLISQVNLAWEKQHLEDGTHGFISGEGNVIMGGFATFRSQLKCHVGFPSGTPQSIPDVTDTIVLWEDPQSSDAMAPDGFYDNGLRHSRAEIYNGTNGQFQPPEQGLWWMHVRINWGTVGAGNRSVYIRGVLGGVDYAHNSIQANGAGLTPTQEVSCLIPFPDPLKQYEFGNLVPSPVVVVVNQDSGGALDLSTAPERISATLVKFA